MDKPSKPKPSLPLYVLEAIGKIERPTAELLEDCAKRGEPMGSLLDVGKLTEIMRSSAADSFKARAEFYESQSGFCRTWLDEAADEALDATLKLAPLRLTMGYRYRENVPSIADELRRTLRARVEERLNCTRDINEQQSEQGGRTGSQSADYGRYEFSDGLKAKSRILSAV